MIHATFFLQIYNNKFVDVVNKTKFKNHLQLHCKDSVIVSSVCVCVCGCVWGWVGACVRAFARVCAFACVRVRCLSSLQLPLTHPGQVLLFIFPSDI